ncbi:MAG: hypothetical protein IPM98_06095 [Lewinellaceae bacterium]|nr:hypothetical protein [Lewinellaceae bacterium]
MFRIRCCAWTGSDGTISVPLSNGKTIWLMGDSFIGEVNPDTSRSCKPRIVNNSILLQDDTTFTTFYNNSDTTAYLSVSDTTLMWPGHGFVAHDTIYLFYYELLKSTTSARVNTKLVKLRESDLAILDISNLPEMDSIFWGRYIFEEGDHRYIFGNRVEAGASRKPYLARVSTNQNIADYAAWEFYTGSGWSADVQMAASVIPAGQGSVSSYFGVLRIAGKYHIISQNHFLGADIYAWTADQLTGPYTNRTTIYNTQAFREYQGCQLFTYNASIHPQFNDPAGLLISFNVMPNRNDTNCSVSHCGINCCPPCGICLHPLVLKNADTYRPKFVRIPFSVINAVSVHVAPRVFLQGPFVGAAQRMHDSLRVQGLIPLTEPYTGMMNFIHVGGGGEQTRALVLSASGENAIVDWVFVELRDPGNPVQVLATRSALLQRDGDVVDVDGISPVGFPLLPDQDYQIVLRHRNHLGVQLGAPVYCPATSALEIDFSALPPQGFYSFNGLSPAQRLISGRYALWAGNGRIDPQLKYNGSNNDRTSILSVVGLFTANSVVPGYYLADYNLDGVVKYNGSANDRNVLLGNVGILTPSAVVEEQVAR